MVVVMILPPREVFDSCLFFNDEGARDLYRGHLASMGPIGESEGGEILASHRMSNEKSTLAGSGNAYTSDIFFPSWRHQPKAPVGYMIPPNSSFYPASALYVSTAPLP